MRYLIGIDEVGRGCLAGPVTVAAVAIPAAGIKYPALGVKLRDSKKLSAKQREAWFAVIKKHPKILYARANVYPKTIDRINISKAANLAATRALARLLKCLRYKVKGVRVLLDGGLYILKTFDLKPSTFKTVIRGDEKYNCVKLASIVAKVGRDRVISRNHYDYPEYGLAWHKGYGTAAHIKAIKKHGPCGLHRLTFIKNFYNIGR